MLNELHVMHKKSPDVYRDFFYYEIAIIYLVAK